MLKWLWQRSQTLCRLPIKMQRETRKITTPAGHEIEVVAYLTGRDKRAITNVYIGENISVDPVTQAVKGINSAMIDKGQEVAWKTIIISIDGKKEPEISIVDTILDMRSEEYDFIVKNVNEIVGSNSEKKTS